MTHHIMHSVSVAALAIGLAAPTTASAQSETQGFGTEEIIITARKRAESLQSAPITVGAITAEGIQQLAVRDIADIARTIPGISFENDFGRQGDRPVIRGQASILGESGVAFFIDGVYTTNSITNINVQEIERVEVVKGPQSALYGRNTYAGAINIITRRPGDEIEARVMAEAAEFGDLQFTGHVSGPVTDTLGFVLSGRYYERDGTFTNQFDGDDLGDEQTTSLSGGLFFNPSDSASFDLRMAWSEDRDGPIPSFLQGADANNCFQDDGFLYNGANRYFCGTVDAQESSLDYSRQFTTRPGFNRDRFTVSLQSQFDFDFATFTHIIGYNKYDERESSDSDHSDFSFEPAFFAGFPLGAPPGAPLGVVYGGIVDFSFEQENETSEFSTEFRLESNSDGPLEWMVGGFYLDIDDTTQFVRNIPATAQAQADANFDAGLDALVDKANGRAPFPGFYSAFIPPILLPSSSFDSANPSGIIVSQNRDETQTRNIAAFGRVAYDVSEALNLSVEVRYASEKFDALRIIQNVGEDPSLTVNGTGTFNSFTPRFTVDYTLTDENLLYANVAKGIKPGGLNGATAIQLGATSFDEEEIWSFEVGTKNTFFDNQLQLNAAAFYNTITGYQLTQTVAAGNGTTSATTNVGDADVYGIEVEGRYTPAGVPGLTFTFNGTWLDSEFTDGADQNQGVLDDVADDMLVNCSLGDEFPDDGVDCTESAFGSIVGKQIPRQANWQLFGDITYRGDITDAIGFYIGANIAYESDKFVQVHNEASFGEFTIVNLQAGIQGDFWELQVFGRNITDEDSPVAVVRYADGQEDFRRAFFGVQRPGSQWGGRVIFKY